MVEAGLHPATGGTGLQACSGDMLLEALAACAGVTLRAVATSLEIPVRGGSVRSRRRPRLPGYARGEQGSGGRLSGDPGQFDLDSDATPEQLDTLQKLTERYCVVLQTLRSPPAQPQARLSCTATAALAVSQRLKACSSSCRDDLQLGAPAGGPQQRPRGGIQDGSSRRPRIAATLASHSDTRSSASPRARRRPAEQIPAVSRSPSVRRVCFRSCTRRSASSSELPPRRRGPAPRSRSPTLRSRLGNR